MDIAVSVIVPIYNVEKYLRQCIDSILNQSLTNIEVILVDDGSPDNCGAIADEYALKDDRVKVIHQENQGLGPARNMGIKVAQGKYVGFVDSDDYVRPAMYANLYEAAIKGDYDIVSGGHDECMDDGEVRRFVHPFSRRSYRDCNSILNIRKKFFGHLYSKDGNVYFPVSAWRSIYKRSIIVENNLSFREILSEDIFFDLAIYKLINSVIFVSTTDYCYRKQGQPSITRTFSESKLARYRDVIINLKKLADEENDPECVLRVQCHAVDRCREYTRLVNGSGDTIKNRKKYLKNFAEDNEIKKCWEGFPLKYLPIKQRIFHWLILKKLYGCALLLAKVA